MWLNLAGSRGVNDGIRKLLEAKMSPEQIERAQKIARDWQPKSSTSFWNNFKGKLGLN